MKPRHKRENSTVKHADVVILQIALLSFLTLSIL